MMNAKNIMNCRSSPKWSVAIDSHNERDSISSLYGKNIVVNPEIQIIYIFSSTYFISTA
jgi:hypothetical protein